MMNFIKKFILQNTITFALLVVVCFIGFLYILSPQNRPAHSKADKAIIKMEEKYYKTLDDWVARGGSFKADEVENRVIEPCGKLVMMYGTIKDKVLFMTFNRDEYHFLTSTCLKLTAQRITPQPEFEDAIFVEEVCDKEDYILFKRLCGKAGLRKVNHDVIDNSFN
jgi:hypothetical protein